MAAGHQKIITKMPLTTLWRDGVVLDAKPVRRVGDAEIRELLRTGGVCWAVASVGDDLAWFDGAARFEVWKAELQPGLVPLNTDKIFLERYPDQRCYTASEWRDSSGHSIVLFEKHH